MQLLVEALELLQEAPWTTIFLEQMHGVGAQLHKYHRRYGSQRLRSRSTCIFARPLAAKLRSKRHPRRKTMHLAMLKRKNPWKTSGKALFLRKHVLAALARLGKNATPGARRKCVKRTVTKNGTDWRRLSRLSKKTFDIQAAMEANERNEALQQEIAACEQELEKDMPALTKEEEDDDFGSGNPLRSARVCWDDADLDALNVMWASEDFSPSEVTRLRKEVEDTILPPGPAERERLQAFDLAVEVTDEPAVTANWAYTVAKNREAFYDVVLCYGECPCQTSYVLCHAHQQPVWAAFLALDRVIQPYAAADASPAERQLHMNNFHDHNWTVLTNKVFYDDDAVFAGGAPTHVIPCLRYGRRYTAWSDEDVALWQDFVASLPPVRARPAVRKQKATVHDPTLVELHPWVKNITKSLASTSSKQKNFTELETRSSPSRRRRRRPTTRTTTRRKRLVSLRTGEWSMTC